MLAYKFKTEIPESGTVRIPQEILDKIRNESVEIVIFQNSATAQEDADGIRSMMGKYRGSLSTTSEFSRRKTHEKEKDL